ncbi:Uncharacterised protein [Plesiomonas shigelloides]|nr:Uncharacterised protein [Plesiomonas shigelloides]
MSESHYPLVTESHPEPVTLLNQSENLDLLRPRMNPRTPTANSPLCPMTGKPFRAPYMPCRAACRDGGLLMGLSPFFCSIRKISAAPHDYIRPKNAPASSYGVFSVLGMRLHGLMIKNALGAFQEGIPYRSIFVVFPAPKGEVLRHLGCFSRITAPRSLYEQTPNSGSVYFSISYRTTITF